MLKSRLGAQEHADLTEELKSHYIQKGSSFELVTDSDNSDYASKLENLKQGYEKEVSKLKLLVENKTKESETLRIKMKTDLLISKISEKFVKPDLIVNAILAGNPDISEDLFEAQLVNFSEMVKTKPSGSLSSAKESEHKPKTKATSWDTMTFEEKVAHLGDLNAD